MPRRMQSAPENILLAKTTAGTWVALEEVWSDDGELLELRPMRADTPGRPIIQKRERREILARVENALMKSRLREMEREMERELERRLNEFTNGSSPGARYAATG